MCAQWNTTQPLEKENFSIDSNMDGLEGYYAKWNKSEKDNYYMTWLIYVESEKWNKLVSITKQRNRPTDRE